MSNEALFYDEEMTDGQSDPVVSEMPVFLNNHAGNSLIVLQYPTRKAGQTSQTTRISMKPEAQILETAIDPQLPMQFINSSKGMHRLSQKYSGVLNENSSRFAVGYVKNNAFYITYVPRTGQMRPEFPDKAPLLNSAMLQTKGPEDAANLRSVQMSVKSTSQELPKHSVALEYWRQANKEESVNYNLGELSQHQRDDLLASQVDDPVEVDSNIFRSL